MVCYSLTPKLLNVDTLNKSKYYAICYNYHITTIYFCL